MKSDLQISRVLENPEDYKFLSIRRLILSLGLAAERKLRLPAVGRKNYYGNHALWSGELLTICMSIFETAMEHRIDPVTYLRIYFDAYCKDNSVLENIDAYLPWNISPEVIKNY